MVPNNPYGQLALARAAWRTRRNTLAQQAFEQAVACSGRDADVLAEFAWFMANARGPKLAEATARDAIEADGQSSTAWASLGIALHRLHREHEAEESLSRALELDPNNVQAQSAMLVLLQFRGETGKAAALAEVMQDAAGAEKFVESARRRAGFARPIANFTNVPKCSGLCFNRPASGAGSGSWRLWPLLAACGC